MRFRADERVSCKVGFTAFEKNCANSLCFQYSPGMRSPQLTDYKYEINRGDRHSKSSRTFSFTLSRMKLYWLPMHEFLAPDLNFPLPFLGLTSYSEHSEDEVHRQSDAPADQREEEP